MTFKTEESHSDTSVINLGSDLTEVSVLGFAEQMKICYLSQIICTIGALT